MKKKIVLTLGLAGVIFAGCAHHSKNTGGSSDETTAITGGQQSNPPRNPTWDANPGYTTNINSSYPRQQ